MNYIGITESVVADMLMTFVEVAGLVIIMIIGVVYVAQGNADFGTLGDFDTGGNPIFALVAGVALAFFAMTGFENAANVAEETINPAKTFPRALIGGMLAAGVIYVLVAITAALTVPTRRSRTPTPPCSRWSRRASSPSGGDHGHAVRRDRDGRDHQHHPVAVVTQSRILYGMAREDVVPGVFAKIHAVAAQPLGGADLLCDRGDRAAGDRRPLNKAGVGVDVVERLASSRSCSPCHLRRW